MQEKVFIKNSKGLKLASIIHYPGKDRQYPVIMILHGFTGYKEEAHFEKLEEILVKNGFAVIRFDASGSGSSEGSFEKDYSMSNFLKDINSVYNYLQKLEFVNKDKIGIVGHSMGGLLSIAFASLNPEIYACVAISSPVILTETDWIKGAIERWEDLGWFYKKISRKDSDTRIPFSFITDANKFDALSYIKKLRCPFLTVLGLSDDVVSPGDSRRIFQAANGPRELIEIEGMNHDYKQRPEIVRKVNIKVLDFLKKYC
jgi:dipeptidyl aminopeptidase/acylaminoacyl peptidase